MKLFLKILAVVSSVVLVAGFLWYRAGDRLLPSTKSGRVAPVETEEERAILPGSKSGIVVSAPATTQPQREREMTIMPGSKSLSPLIESDGPAVPGAGADQSQKQ